MLTFEEIPSAIEILLQKVEALSLPVVQEERDKIMSIEEAATFLNCSVEVIYKNKSVPRSKRLGRLYFFESKLRKWLEEGEVKQHKLSIFTPKI